MNDNATIAVVGAGVIGLTTAIRLREAGRNAEVFAARRTPEITSNTYGDWWINNGIIALAAQAVVAKFVETFKEFPPIQKPNTFTVDDALAKMSEAASS